MSDKFVTELDDIEITKKNKKKPKPKSAPEQSKSTNIKLKTN